MAGHENESIARRLISRLTMAAVALAFGWAAWKCGGSASLLVKIIGGLLGLVAVVILFLAIAPTRWLEVFVRPPPAENDYGPSEKGLSWWWFNLFP